MKGRNRRFGRYLQEVYHIFVALLTLCVEFTLILCRDPSLLCRVLLLLCCSTLIFCQLAVSPLLSARRGLTLFVQLRAEGEKCCCTAINSRFRPPRGAGSPREKQSADCGFWNESHKTLGEFLSARSLPVLHFSIA
jgi:hypothetical protein